MHGLGNNYVPKMNPPQPDTLRIRAIIFRLPVKMDENSLEMKDHSLRLVADSVAIALRSARRFDKFSCVPLSIRCTYNAIRETRRISSPICAAIHV